MKNLTEFFEAWQKQSNSKVKLRLGVETCRPEGVGGERLPRLEKGWGTALEGRGEVTPRLDGGWGEDTLV